MTRYHELNWKPISRIIGFGTIWKSSEVMKTDKRFGKINQYD